MNEVFLDELAEPDPAPEDRPESRRSRDERRRRRRRRSAITLLLSVLIVAAVAAVAFLAVRPLFENRGGDDVEDYPGPGTGEALVIIEPGSTGQDMGELLVENNVVASVGAFTRAFGAEPDAAGIQPGTYVLREEMAAADAVDALLDPATRAEVTITVPEGFQSRQVHERIASVAELDLAEVEAAAADAEAIGLPAEAGGNPEGWYAAATYAFEPSADATEILSTMVAETVARLEERGVPAGERQELLIKASIVEREVNIEEYYGKVARVIENRLAEGSETAGFLGLDSTVLYGLGRSGGIPTTAETDDTDNPYNTYVHKGLPPTPIGAPGPAAIEAVLDPPEGDWEYFVTVDLNTGETKFAATHDEHLQNVQELRQWVEDNPDWEDGGDGEG